MTEFGAIYAPGPQDPVVSWETDKQAFVYYPSYHGNGIHFVTDFETGGTLKNSATFVSSQGSAHLRLLLANMSLPLGPTMDHQKQGLELVPSYSALAVKFQQCWHL